MLTLGLLALAALGGGPASTSEAPMSTAAHRASLVTSLSGEEICALPTAEDAAAAMPQVSAVSVLRRVRADRPAPPAADWCIDQGDGTDPRCGSAPGSDRPVHHTSANPGTHHAPVVTAPAPRWPGARGVTPPVRRDLVPAGLAGDRLDRPPRR